MEATSAMDRALIQVAKEKAEKYRFFRSSKYLRD
jgi:hypothetical protein